jgi:hypothetical protein
MNDHVEEKRCIACKHYDPGIYSLKAGGTVRPKSCNHPSNRSLVDGQPELDPYRMRVAHGMCGLIGKLWEQK